MRPMRFSLIPRKKPLMTSLDMRVWEWEGLPRVGMAQADFEPRPSTELRILRIFSGDVFSNFFGAEGRGRSRNQAQEGDDLDMT